MRTGGRRVGDRARGARSGGAGWGAPRACRAGGGGGSRWSHPRARAAPGRARAREKSCEAQARKAPGTSRCRSRDAGDARSERRSTSGHASRYRDRAGEGGSYAPMVLTRRCAGQKGLATRRRDEDVVSRVWFFFRFFLFFFSLRQSRARACKNFLLCDWMEHVAAAVDTFRRRFFFVSPRPRTHSGAHRARPSRIFAERSP